MTPLMASVTVEVETIYGWCGLCHSFAEFPHECLGKNQPVQDLDGVFIWQT
jgi:hypothetical protein